MRARLFKPTPLDTPLTIDVTDDRVLLLERDDVLVEGVSASLDLDVPRPPAFDEAAEATQRFVARDDHAFPGCFVCGTGRGAGDGLRVFAGPLRDREIVAAPWIPDRTLSANDQVGNEFIWAVLDCPGFFASCIRSEPRPSVLGEMTTRIDRPVSLGERCVVIAWPLGRAGRKLHVASALFGENASLVGAARATWFEV